jgi:hypothetical protein
MESKQIAKYCVYGAASLVLGGIALRALTRKCKVNKKKLMAKISNSKNNNLNADLTKRIVMRPRLMAWTRSGATSTVERKRLFRAGGQESGAVTSIVRYLPGASFPPHPHPQGEEIFVLAGIFKDQRGAHKAGTFLLNPEGFKHAPSSVPGNEILVRLRQYPHVGSKLRPQRAVDTNAMAWTPLGVSGVSRKVLFDERPVFPEVQWLERWAPGTTTIKPRQYADGLEVLVVEGSFTEEGDSDAVYERHDWLRLPAGATFAPQLVGTSQCIVLLKSGGLKHAIPASA